MQSNRMGWPGAAIQVAYWHPVPPRVCATPRIPEDPTVRAELRALDNPAPERAASLKQPEKPAGFKAGDRVRSQKYQTWGDMVVTDAGPGSIVLCKSPVFAATGGFLPSELELIPSDTTDADGWVAWDATETSTNGPPNQGHSIDCKWSDGSIDMFRDSEDTNWDRTRSIWVIAYRLVK